MKTTTLKLMLAVLCLGNTISACKKTTPVDGSDKPVIIAPPVDQKTMILEGLTGALTAKEIAGFKNHIASVAAPAKGDANVWVFGNPGKAIEACGLMYEATKDLAILDRMIFYCDASLSQRNDLAAAASGGQLATWTGNIDPVWPSSSGTVPAAAGIEQGSVLAHQLYCARLILEQPSIWNTLVNIVDSKGYGATYKARALKYIQEADYVMDNWILPRFVRQSDLKLYFPGAPNTYKPNEAAPWNQLFMVTNAMVRLAQCHTILQGADQKVKKYEDVVKANLAWFRENLTAKTSPIGSPCWNWRYAIGGSIEDTNHAAYDVEGLWIIYNSGRYGLTANDLIPFGNTYFDIVLATVTNGIYAGKVDGTTGTGNSDGDNYVRDEYLYLADVMKDKYDLMANIEIKTNKIASSPQITARLLWLKNKRFLGK
jgi:hypothetical protein